MCAAYNMNSLSVNGSCNHKIIITLIIIAWRYKCAMKSYREKRDILIFLTRSWEWKLREEITFEQQLKKKKNLLNCWSKRYKTGNLMLKWGCCLQRNGFRREISRSGDQHKLHLEWREGLCGIRGWKWNLGEGQGSLAKETQPRFHRPGGMLKYFKLEKKGNKTT